MAAAATKVLPEGVLARYVEWVTKVRCAICVQATRYRRTQSSRLM